jgi:hypothetical protein
MFPKTKEGLGRFVGIAENIGDVMTYYIVAENGTILASSSVRSAAGSNTFNHRLLYEARSEGSFTDGWLGPECSSAH